MEKTNRTTFQVSFALNYSLKDKESNIKVKNMLKNKSKLPWKRVVENINNLLEEVDKKDILVEVKGGKYFYDNDKNSIVFAPPYTHEQILLGNGEINLYAIETKNENNNDSVQLAFFMLAEPSWKKLLDNLLTSS